jgi:putative PIN family toxin of toxin-antitoxin system
VRLVLDSNVLLAAFLARGVCHELLEHCARAHRIIASELLLREVEAKLRSKFTIPARKANQVVELLRAEFEIVEPAALPEPVCRDADDDWILATAVTGRCACLVTGDQDLLVLEEYEGIGIVTPSAFWRLESSSGPGSPAP